MNTTPTNRQMTALLYLPFSTVFDTTFFLSEHVQEENALETVA